MYLRKMQLIEMKQIKDTFDDSNDAEKASKYTKDIAGLVSDERILSAFK